MILSKLKNLVRFLTLVSTDDSAGRRFGVVAGLGKNQKALIFTPYGLMHHPPAGSLALCFNQQAQESNIVGMADDPDNRTLKGLAEGEVAVGNYLTGNYILFDEAGLCTLIAEDLKVQVTNDITVTAKNLNIAIDEATTLNTGTLEIESDTTMDITAGSTMNLTATDAMALIAATIGLTSTGTASITAPALEHAGVNIGSTHIHSQGNDSDGDSEVDTGVPHS